MGSTFDDAVSAFDLNYFSTNTTAAIETKYTKLRKALSTIKKKIIKTDDVISVFNAQKDALKNTEKQLRSTNEECMKIRVDYANTLEKCSNLEKERELLLATNAELQEKNVCSENRFQAMESYNNQLQSLVESMKIENKLDASNVKEYEKRIAALTKDKDELIENICRIKNVVFGKRKLSKNDKTMLAKYKNSKYVSEAESDNDDGIFDSPSSPEDFVHISNDKDELSVLKKGFIEVTTKECNAQTERIDHDEVISVDTGRGSSLGSTLNSPEYYHLLHAEFTANKEKITLVNVATSPIPFHYNNVATSPITVMENNEKNTLVNAATSPVPTHYMDVTSPVNEIEKKLSQNLQHKFKIPKIVMDKAMSPIIFDKVSDHSEVVEYTSMNCSDSTNIEKECLDVNSSISLIENSRSDIEVEMILNQMRLDRLITPMPPTPSSSRTRTSSTASTDTLSFSSLRQTQTSLMPQILQTTVDADFTVKDSREEKDINAKVRKLSKEMRNVKKTIRNYGKVFQMGVPINLTVALDSKNDVNNHENIIKILNSENVSLSKILNNSIKNNSHDFLNNVDPVSDLSDSERLEIDESSQVGVMHTTETVKPSQMLKFSDKVPCSDILNDSLENDTSMENKDVNRSVNKKIKAKTLSKLEKMRSKFMPKGKIKRVQTPPLKRSRQRPKPDPLKEKLEKAIDFIGLNHKAAHEKAAKVLAEFNFKQKAEPKLRRRSQRLSSKDAPSQKYMLSNEAKDTESNKSINTALNSKTVNEKVGKVIAELNSKQRVESKLRHTSQRVSSKKDTTPQKEQLSDITKAKFVEDNKTGTNERHYRTQTQNRNIVVRHNDGIIYQERPDLKESSCFVKLTKIDDIIKALHTSPKRHSSLELDNTISISSAKKDFENKRVLRSSIQSSPKDSMKKTIIEKQSKPPKAVVNMTKNSLTDKDTELMLNKYVVRSMEYNADENFTAENGVKSTSSPKNNVRTRNGVKINMSNQETNISKTANNCDVIDRDNTEISRYGDTIIDEITPPIKKRKCVENEAQEKSNIISNLKDSVLCRMIEKYGPNRVKTTAKPSPDSVLNPLCKKIEDAFAKIAEVPLNEVKPVMIKLSEDLRNLEPKRFLRALMKYLEDPARKVELYNKVTSSHAPPMTKSEQALIFVLTQLKSFWPSVDIINCTLINIEYTLFKLYRTPDFDAIESMAHFYAVLCRYIKAKSRLRLFMLDAMYCLQFKAVPLIKQCMEVWMHVLPLAHLGIAKSPLVTCIVYLLHYYKCHDKFQRVQDMRTILNRKYSYQITEWNETKILEMFKNSIKELREIPIEKKMLRMALIILAKRHGPRWCHKNIIKNILQPMIETVNVPERVKIFCVSALGPLLKPYPLEMKVHCEIVMNQLIDMLEQNPSKQMEEAIITSLIFMSKHNQNSVTQVLLSWQAQHVTGEMEELLKDYVREKPLKAWRSILSKISLVR